MATAIIAVNGLAACGSSSENQDVTAFRANAGQTSSGTWAARYRLNTTGQKAQANVDIDHAKDQLRLDITTAQGVATNISGPTGEVSCQTSPSKKPVCLQVAALGGTPAAALDPALRSVVQKTLPAIASGDADVQALGRSTDPEYSKATCARVSGNGIAAGVYCLFPDGIPASANFPSGSIAFVQRLPAPTASTFTPPATPRSR